MRRNLIVGDIEIFYKDLPLKTREKGRILAMALKGGDWRLPTEKELLYMYDLSKYGILNFGSGTYWSSEISGSFGNEKGGGLDFLTGVFSFYNLHNNLVVRPVRNI